MRPTSASAARTPVRALLTCAFALALVAAPLRAQELGAALERVLANSTLGKARIAIEVAELERGRVLYARRAHEPQILASNTKLWTCAAALARLGPSYRLETALYRRGTLAGTVLLGDLVLVGGGDPSLGPRFDATLESVLVRFARSVREAGIREVRGAIVADARAFLPPAQHPAWPQDQLDRWYAAPVSALTINDGCVDVTVRPGPQPGAQAVVTMVPHTALLQLDNRCRTVAQQREHRIVIGRKAGTNIIIVRGGVWRRAAPLTHSVALHDPALVTADVLRGALEAEGITVRGGVRHAAADAPPPARSGVLLAAHTTALAQLLPVIGKRSQNLWAESLCRMLGLRGGKGGSFSGGVAVIEAFGREIGIPQDELHLVDGSGLARGNRASAHAIVTLLRTMALGPHGGVFVAALPIGGVDGTLRKRLRDREDAARVRAKTGTIRGVSTLSGYVLPARPDGRTLVFSILVHGMPGGTSAARRLQDRLVAVVLDAAP